MIGPQPRLPVARIALVFSLGLLGSLGSFAASESARAAHFSDTKCVRASVETVRASIENYKAYPSFPGAVMTMEKLSSKLEGPAKAGFKLLMSQDTHTTDQVAIHMEPIILREMAQGTQIGVILHPHDLRTGIELPPAIPPLGDQDLRPRFGLLCSITPADGGFVQKCEFSSPRKPFGVKGFSSTLTASPGKTSTCSTQLSYDITLTGDDADIARLRDRLTSSYNGIFGMAAKAAGSFFNDEFLRAYYENFYEGWVASLSSNP